MHNTKPKQYISIITSKPDENHAEKVNREVDEITDNEGIVLDVKTTTPDNSNKMHWNSVITYTTEFDVAEAEAK